jgi:predicted ATP-dependent endonuclease of OLD family
MIEKLSISNFQSHRKTELSFSPGVNVIVGQSRKGKSAILRALGFVILNKPSGESVISHWAFDEKGKQKYDCLVEIELDNSFSTITRRKGKDNSYIYGVPDENEANGFKAKILTAIGKDMPEEVQKLLNMTELNIQKQLDQPFLLSESAGEIARYFNNIIRLEDIDKMLSGADSLKRSTKAEITEKEMQLKSTQESLDKLGWVENARYRAQKLLKMENRLTEGKRQHEVGSKLINLAISAQQNLSKFSTVEKAVKKARDIFDFNIELESLQINYNKKDRLLAEYKKISVSLNMLTNVHGAHEKAHIMLSLISAINICFKKIIDMTDAIEKYMSLQKQLGILASLKDCQLKADSLSSLHLTIAKKQGMLLLGSTIIGQIIKAGTEKTETESQLKQWQAEMPKVCPLCNQSLLKLEK